MLPKIQDFPSTLSGQSQFGTDCLGLVCLMNQYGLSGASCAERVVRLFLEPSRLPKGAGGLVIWVVFFLLFQWVDFWPFLCPCVSNFNMFLLSRLRLSMINMIEQTQLSTKDALDGMIFKLHNRIVFLEPLCSQFCTSFLFILFSKALAKYNRYGL